MELSFWERQAFFTDLDVVVIGSGIVGLNVALHLKQQAPGLKVLVLERGLLPSGASTRNAGFACFGSPSELLDDLSRYPEEQVFALVEKRWRGLRELRKNLGSRAIGFHSWGGTELFFDDAEFEACASRLDYLNRQLKPLTGQDEVYRVADRKITAYGFGKTRHLIENRAEGQIDTGLMMRALLQKVQQAGVQVLNGIRIVSVQDSGGKAEVQTEPALPISARRVVVATNGFAKQLLPHLPLVPGRAQVLVTAPVPGLKVKGTFHFSQGYYYFRNIGNRILFGGGRNLDFGAEETTDFGLTTLVQDSLEQYLREVILPGQPVAVEQRWSGIMGLGPEKRPLVEAVSENVWCAVRMGGMGVAIGTLVGQEAARKVLESL